MPCRKYQQNYHEFHLGFTKQQRKGYSLRNLSYHSVEINNMSMGWDKKGTVD